MSSLIQAIIKTCGSFFEASTFALSQSSLNTYVISGSHLSLALDNYGNGKREVKVLKWFDDIWMYKEVRIIPQRNKYSQLFITISIFQGAPDDMKTQLFRAEWDNYEVNNSVHPQPHWHIYPFKYDSKTYQDFEAYNEMRSEEEEKEGFVEQLKSNGSKLVDIRNMHFAMNGQWIENKGCKHGFSKDAEVISWLNGIFAHIKEQLFYIK